MIAGTDAPDRPLARWRLPRTHPIELLVAGVALAVAIVTYLVITGEDSPQRPLIPPLVALLLVCNLLPGVLLLVLIGRRVARRRAARSAVGGEGRLHVRLVALFSFLATVPTLLLAIFASLLFQYGVEFWYSDRARGMLENAQTLARESYQQMLSYVDNENVAMAQDLSKALVQLRWSIDGTQFTQLFATDVFQRSLSEAVIFWIGADGEIRTVSLVNPYERDLSKDIDRAAIKEIGAGRPSVVSTSSERTRSITRIPATSYFLYAARVSGAQQMAARMSRAQAVLSDYGALQKRSRRLQLQFNLALLVVSLLIVGIAVWIALAVADRLVRPVGELVGAARRVTEGDLTTRVPATRERDEIGVLSTAFNRMTARLEEQTGELKSANTEAESRRALIEAVMTGVSAGVLSIAEDHEVRLANSSALALLRPGGDSPVGRPLADLSPELDRLLAGGQPEAIVELAVTGEPRTLAVKVAREPGAGFVLTFDDITQQQLDQRRAAWSDVARRIAHEIKNPLTPIQLAAERLQRRYGAKIESDDGTFARLTETIVRQVGDLRRIVDEFSSFARMPKPVFRAEKLADMGRQALFLHEVAHPGVRFRLVCDDPGPVLVCDRRQIGQALTNIVKNAVEAVGARDFGGAEGGEGEVTMTVRGDAREAVVEVADNGIGLPADRERIVEPYMTTRARGTGLGLAIVKKIAEDHLGTIAFSDRPGGGTVVTLSFDAAALAELDTAPPIRADTIRYDRQTILTQSRTG